MAEEYRMGHFQDNSSFFQRRKQTSPPKRGLNGSDGVGITSSLQGGSSFPPETVKCHCFDYL
ncbi:hypothetical protein L0665_00745 [Methanogenium marinum]|uniref:Uncharacterized protein n=1 Tax=Methanogenium marinum TaxID=348610 RepID=A0A9Q4KRK5_9EURY|nr:hypothetical protein [Methanogenium marinum]MDE4907156.1 hypothetical protein [Methanogenium marinum]